MKANYFNSSLTFKYETIFNGITFSNLNENFASIPEKLRHCKNAPGKKYIRAKHVGKSNMTINAMAFFQQLSRYATNDIFFGVNQHFLYSYIGEMWKN